MAKRKTTKRKTIVRKKRLPKTCSTTCSSGGGAYFLGFVGAAIYYVSNATGFWNGVLGVLKALVWPAMLVYNLLQFLGM